MYRQSALGREHGFTCAHASRINDAEANETVLLNLHDGMGWYQMLAGVFRFFAVMALSAAMPSQAYACLQRQRDQAGH